ncbi:MAG TPA: MYXO-CTERM sorting domain-containing protein [Myxococcus sp.]|nr:MYXO-CTERM sorting domain-containing protein [Myxococcus sp.]
MTPWQALPITPLAVLTGVMAVTETDGGTPHALFRTQPDRLVWFREGLQQAELQVSDNPRGVDFAVAGGTDLIAFYGSNAGIFRAPLRPSATPVLNAFTRVTVLNEPAPRVAIASLDVNTGSGSELGEGFGLAVGTVEGAPELVVLGAVPADSAEDAGTVWRVHERIGAPGAPVAPIQVSCVDATYCVIALGRPNVDGENLIVYTNASAPQVDGDTAPLRINEGATSPLLQFSALDEDGDAVRMSLDASTAPLVAVTSMVAAPDSLSVVLTAGSVCQTTDGTLRVQASDGLKAHDQRTPVTVTVVNTRNPGQPGVTPTEAETLGEPEVFMASPVSGPCATVGYQWTSEQPTQPALVTDGGTATFTPPPNVLCTAAGGSFTYRVRGLDPGLVPSDPASFTVTVSPWGRPSAPFGPDARRTLESGPNAGVDLVPEALHTCIENQGLPREQLPPLETEWRLTDPAAGLPEGLTFRAEDGGTLSPGAPVTSNTLRVEAGQCISARLSLTARHRLRTANGPLDGPEATVQVEVAPPLEDFARAELALSVDPGNDRQVRVAFGTEPNCPSDQIRARMVLEGLDGSPLYSEDVRVPHPWMPELPQVCAATYTVRGQLVDFRTTPERLGDQATTTLTVGPRLEPLEGDALVARCGEGASGRLTQPITPAACTGLAVSWTQVGEGPRLVDAPLSGESVTVATEESAPLEELVGQSVTVRVTARTEEGASSAREHVLPITTEPFVDIRHDLESPTGSEKSLVGVVVELSNTTGCEVGNLRYVERPEGLEPIPGTVKLDGQPLAETPVEGGFSVEGVRLAAQATGRLTYVARPRLLTSPRFSGEVFLNQVPVSGTIPPPSSSGCGCSGGGSGAAVFGLLALARLLRRRGARG